MGVTDGRPILDPEVWKAGTDLDRAAWSLASREHLLDAMRQTVAICRRDFYDPADPNDWAPFDMEYALGRAEEVASGRTDADRLAFTQAVADFLKAIPDRMREPRSATLAT